MVPRLLKSIAAGIGTAAILTAVAGALLSGPNGNPVGAALFFGVVGALAGCLVVPISCALQSVVRTLVSAESYWPEVCGAIAHLSVTAVLIWERSRDAIPGSEVYCLSAAFVLTAAGLVSLPMNRPSSTARIDER